MTGRPDDPGLDDRTPPASAAHPRGRLTRAVDEWVRLAGATVSGRPLAATRSLVGLAALVFYVAVADRLDAAFDPAGIHVPWPIVGDRLLGLPVWVVAVPWLVGAVLLTVGVVPRCGAVGVAVGLGLATAVDRQRYANGGYFILLLVILLALSDCGASRTPWGPDRRRARWWPTFLLAAQLTIVYLFSAVQKVRPVSLAGDTVDWQLRGVLTEWITWSHLPQALNLLGGVAELGCAVGLWFRRTRRLAVVVGIVLHLGIFGFIRGTWDLLAFGLASVAVYPCFWSAREPLVAARQRLRTDPGRSG